MATNQATVNPPVPATILKLSSLRSMAVLVGSAK